MELWDVTASPRDANTIFITLNNWHRGDYEPYIVKSADRGRTWTNITGDLPDRHDVWAIVQDHVDANLLFAGTDFGLFFTVDGGAHWIQMKGGLPTIQVRDLAIQKRENDLVLAMFGRGLYVLDDYNALRDITPQTLTPVCATPATGAREPRVSLGRVQKPIDQCQHGLGPCGFRQERGKPRSPRGFLRLGISANGSHARATVCVRRRGRSFDRPILEQRVRRFL